MTTASGSGYRRDQRFFTAMAIFVSVLSFFGFAQFAARGIPDYAGAPLHIHLHGLIYTAWLVLFPVQNVLAGSGNLALHRRLGKLGCVLILAMIVIGSYAGLQSIARDHVPPHYTPAYFLVLVQLAAVSFGALAIAGLVKRRDTQAHRRLMLMAAILIADPAIDRMLPGPLVGGPMLQWVIMAIQLVLAGLVLLHDRRLLGRVHAATWWGIAAIVASHVLTDLLARLAAVEALAEAMLPA